MVSNEFGATLVIGGLELPFVHRTELRDYGNGTLAYRFSFRCFGRTYEVWEVFDFEARPDRVKITIVGAMPIPGQIKIPLRAGNGSLVEYDDASKTIWCAKIGDLEDKLGRVGFDWKDMESIATFFPSTNTITANVSGNFIIDPSTVDDTLTINTATQYPYQRKSFYANSRYWVFYSDGTNMVYKTSTDGSTWSSATSVRACTSGDKFSIWFDGTYVHYAYADLTADTPLYYRRGTPNADGTITWSTEQTAGASYTSWMYKCPMVSVDSGGYPWIGFRRQEVSGATYYYPYVIKSSTNDGTFVRDTTIDSSGYKKLSTTSVDYWHVSPIPLTGGKVYVIYARYDYYVYGILWSGSAWGSQELSTSYINWGYHHSAVANGDDVHLVFLKFSTYDIIYRKRTYGTGWGSEVTVQSATTSTSAPVLSIDTATGNLYCFWAGSPTAGHIYYKMCVSGTWDSTATDWINEATDGITGNAMLTGFYKDYGSKIGLVYMTKTASPYKIRFAYLTPGQVPEFPIGPFLLLIPVMAIYFQLRRRFMKNN